MSRNIGFLDRLLPKDAEKRDLGSARQSFNDFADLVTHYPNSVYAPDARQRMVYVKNRLAAYEINVARYYLRRQAYVAAANRGRYVFENFQGTPSVPEGLAIMIEAYRNLNMISPAEDALQVLLENYPDHPSLTSGGDLKKNQRWGRSVLRIATFGPHQVTPARMRPAGQLRMCCSLIPLAT